MSWVEVDVIDKSFVFDLLSIVFYLLTFFNFGVLIVFH